MKLRFTEYRKEFHAFTLIFDLIKYSLQELGDKAFREFMESKRTLEDAGLETRLAMLKSHGLDSVGLLLKQHHKKKMSQQYPVTKTLKWAEYKGDAQFGLNASELILRVALFESFMKEIHRHALKANPRLLSQAKPNRPIKLKDLFHTSFESFKTKEIDRQVRKADRLSTKERAKFFKRKLKLELSEQQKIAEAHRLVEIHHELVHASPNAPVRDNDIGLARDIFLSIPQNCFKGAVVHYQSQFDS
jgi:hypothetical protein